MVMVTITQQRAGSTRQQERRSPMDEQLNMLTVPAGDLARHVGAWVEFEFHLPCENLSSVEAGYLHHVQDIGVGESRLVCLSVDKDQTLHGTRGQLGGCAISPEHPVTVFTSGAPGQEANTARRGERQEALLAELTTAAFRIHVADPEAVLDPDSDEHSMFAAGFRAGHQS
jgi:hypothetical protein